MKSTSIRFLTIASVALADYNVSFVTESSNTELSNKGLTYLHEGAGINVVFLSQKGSVLTYAEDYNEFYLPVSVDSENGPEVKKWNLTVPATGGINFYPLSVGVAGGTPVLVKDNYLTVNGSSTLYAAKGLKDAYGYSKKSYELLATKIPNSHPLKVRVVSEVTVANQTSSLNGTNITALPSTTPLLPTSPVPEANGGVATQLGSALAIVAAAAFLL